MKREITHLFTCGCGMADDLIHADFIKHLSEVHHLETKDLKGKKEIIMHIDGDKFYSSTYKWTLENGLEFTEFFESTRSKKGRMY